MAVPDGSPRRVSRLLSGYLCGTHSGLLSRDGMQRSGAASIAIASAHHALGRDRNGWNSELGGVAWRPGDAALSRRLRSALGHPAVIDLVVFGSQARASVTGFSDVDAILILEDGAADDPSVLRSLRPRVLAAQREVLAYQPMQHHGFEVVTPTLLRKGSESLALPAAALSETRSLFGRPVAASLSDALDDGHARLRALAADLVWVRSWPSHVWQAHRVVAMFELLPTLYLQSRGRAVPKWRSFEEARNDFRDAWEPYDVLEQVRTVWPRKRRLALDLAAASVRNPWAALAAWRRLQAPVPADVRSLLTPNVLDGLQELAHRMAEPRDA